MNAELNKANDVAYRRIIPENPSDSRARQMLAELDQSAIAVESGWYRHFKGGLYRVLCTAKHSETDETFVVYQSDVGETWVRPSSMFQEKVYFEGRFRPRFERVLD